MLRGGITFTLVFKDRSLDFGADSTAQRDFLVKGFKALHAKVIDRSMKHTNTYIYMMRQLFRKNEGDAFKRKRGKKMSKVERGQDDNE